MPDRLKRRPPYSAAQKILDLFFLLAIIIGAYQATDAVKSIAANMANGFTVLLLAQMIAMMVFGILGWRWRIQGKLYKEAIAIPMIAQGITTCIFGSFAQFILLPPEEPFISDLGGLSILVAVFVLIEAQDRFRSIQTLKKLGIDAALARENAAQRTPSKINQKAAEAAKRLKA